jgi:hypothetical protein
MKKRRVTLNLDEDVVQMLESLGGRSLSAAANDALRKAAATEAHRQALARWLDQLDASEGRATRQETAAVEALLDELARPVPSAGAA